MSAMLLLGGLPPVDPHPDLVAAQRPTAAQVMEAAAALGGLPLGSYLAGEISLLGG